MKKWSVADVLVLVLEIIAPVLSLVVTIVFGDKLTADAKLGIITAGVALPIAILQISVTQGQNKNDREIEQINTKFDKIEEEITQISPIMERIFLSNNEMIKRFAYRRMNEATKSVNHALTAHRSGVLRPNEYYEELFYLADIIRQDYFVNSKNYSGEIWAMTSFAEEEWSADQGYEQRWTEELGELVKQGIPTRRLCIISDDIFRIISNPDFQLKTSIDKSSSFKAFWEFLVLYYKNGCSTNVTQFAIRERDSTFLAEIKGFFAVKLANGELHILYGETVDSNGALTSELLFDRNEIQRARTHFERHSTHSIGEFVSKYGSDNFKQTLVENNIFLCIE